MDSSRRAVESYWRGRMIDGATSDEDKVTPVYKLEEICDLLRSSHVSIVKEVSEFVFKRLQHKSPVVKHKALRLIKYAVPKSGVEFRREMQRNSVAVRQLIHYKGQLDPLKGDALNKAVRETAQEALSAIFSTDDNKTAATEDLTQRIQGFGNTNFELPSEDKKSFLSEVVGIGSATIKQGLNSLTQTQSPKRNETGSYKSPNLRRSLTTENDYSDRYGEDGHRAETLPSSRFSKNVAGNTWAQDSKTVQTETTSGNSSSSYSDGKTREGRLLETIVTSGGVRLQPTRDALQVFLEEASKLDALALSHALESKLQSHMWQACIHFLMLYISILIKMFRIVRMKAVCVLEAILRKKDDEHLSIVASYFSENKDIVAKCSESPQASLREKANKVLSLLDGEQTSGGVSHLEKQVKAEKASVPMPDLIDTGDPDDVYGTEATTKLHGDHGVGNLMMPTSLIIDDLFGDGSSTGTNTSEHRKDDDPFADVSFHTSNNKEDASDLFSGMTADKPGAAEVHIVASTSGSELLNLFGSGTEVPMEQREQKTDVNNLMAGLSINGNDSFVKQNGKSGGLSETIFSDSTTNPSHQVSNDANNLILGSQGVGINASSMFSLGPMAYNIPPGMTMNPAFPSQPINYGAMGSLFAQQQFLATMSNFQQLGNLHSQNSAVGQATGTQVGGNYSPFPDIFNPTMPNQTPSSMLNSSKKEETRAFDFISVRIYCT
ncbi:hypothetical protein RJ640_022691 [Escallonia rubra]|uniref:VHS domain-containing protein n=1 Tax=Escallonia rubra TaxID=112253 RepID=A0AA88R9N8_9ASTE|nr:hypothetical protein RJ640_022691 [Escallonia rubra]